MGFINTDAAIKNDTALHQRYCEKVHLHHHDTYSLLDLLVSAWNHNLPFVVLQSGTTNLFYSPNNDNHELCSHEIYEYIYWITLSAGQGVPHHNSLPTLPPLSSTLGSRHYLKEKQAPWKLILWLSL